MTLKQRLGGKNIIILTLICCIAVLSGAFVFSSATVYADTFSSKSAGIDIIDDSANLEKVICAVRNEMQDRKEDISLTIAVSDQAYRFDTEGGTQNIIDTVSSGIYSDIGITDKKELARSGDYLKMTASIPSFDLRNASVTLDGYDCYDITIKASYTTTKNMEDEVDLFLERWQREFIDNNAVINSCSTENERKYYIVKTIFNFLAYNTVYDYDVYEYNINRKEPYDEVKEAQLGPESGQFKNSHSAYGALFGNTINSEKNVDPDCYKWETVTDSTGLCRIKNYNQGLSVCDGFSMVTYYLCRLNGIDCKIVTGDYTADSGKNSDPHAWNLIRLGPSNSNSYSEDATKWYHCDATYSVKAWNFLDSELGNTGIENPASTYKISSEASDIPVFKRVDTISVIDYSYFLRGYENVVFSPVNHQQISEAVNDFDAKDYILHSDKIDCSNAWTILTRRKDVNQYNNLENYFLISPDKKFYKINKSKLQLEECTNSSIVYNGNTYYYSLAINNYANGIEYICDGQTAKDAQTYTFNATAVDSDTSVYQLPFRISPIDMSDWNAYTSFKCNDEELKNNRLSDIEFTGAEIDFDVDVYDVADKELTRGTEYALYIEDAYGNKVTPFYPGSYQIIIDFDINQSDNYKEQLKIPFNIIKGDIGKMGIEPLNNLTYGTDVISGCTSLSLKDSNTGLEITMKNGVDYYVYMENPAAVNYGNDGHVVYVVLPGNPYFKEGTYVTRYYKIANPYNAGSLFNGTSTNSSYGYTGAPVTPHNFSMTVSFNGSIYTLRENVDYVIAAYSNNVNAGTGYVTVNFIGNYCGSATMSFEIVGSSNQNSGAAQNTQMVYVHNPQVDVTLQDNLVYTGKAQTPAATVVVDGKTLSYGIDYTVSTVPAQVGVYECTIQGLGGYSYLNVKKPVMVSPSKITGGKNSSSSKNAVRIRWNSQGSNCYYQIYTYDAGRKKWVLMAVTTNTSFKTTYGVKNNKKLKLKPDMVCKFRVRCCFSATINGVSYNKYGSFARIDAATKVSAPSSPKVKKGKKSMKVTWKKVSGAAGYEIQYSTNSKFKKKNKTVKINKGKTTSKTIKKLKSKKTYYVRIRAFKKVNGKKVYSAYTKKIRVKVK